MRFLRSLSILGLVFALVAPLSAQLPRGRKYKEPPPTAHIEVTVIRASNGKPIHNAAVVFHPTKNDKNEGNMEVKTNEEGKTSLDMIPIGSSVLLQVIADGYRTFGQVYKIDGDSKTILVKMELPENQYSTFKAGSKADNAHTNAPQTQMGQAAPTDSPLLAPPAPSKKGH
jgi:hypothetical protein